MKKYFSLLLILVFSVIILTACSNPHGGLGPSWDVAVKLPLLKGTEENTLTVEELLGNDVNIADGYNENLLDNSNLYNIGAELTEVNFPDLATAHTITLKPIKINGLMNPYGQTVNISAGMPAASITVPTVQIPDYFDQLEFAAVDQDGLPQQATLSLTNNSANVVVNSFGVDVVYNDGSQTVTNHLSFGTINPGSNAKLPLLAGRNIGHDDISLQNISINTAGSGSGNLDIKVSFPDIIDSITELNTAEPGVDINYNLAGTINLNGMNIENGVKKVTFAAGNLAVTLPDNIPGLYFSWNSLAMAGISDDDHDGMIDLTDREIDLSMEDLNKIAYQFTIKDDQSQHLTYSAGTDISVKAGFTADTRLASVIMNLDDSSVSLDGFDNSVQVDPIDLTMEQDLREQLSKVEINPQIVATLSGLEGMNMDLSDLQFTALDDSNTVIDQFDLGSNYQGLSPVIDVMDRDPNLLDFIHNASVASIKIGGTYNISGDNVLVKADSKIGIKSIDVHQPYEFSLTDDLVYDSDPKELDPVDKQTRDLIENDTDSKMIIENLNNKFPLAVKLKIYAADISAGNLSTAELKDSLYQDKNLLKEISIEQRSSYAKFPLEINADKIDVFTRDNVYVGLRAIISKNQPGDSYEFMDGDRISFDKIYLAITGRINK